MGRPLNEIAQSAEEALRHRAGPIQGAQRVAVVDLLRGFALLGILAVNMGGFAYPLSKLMNGSLPRTSVADHVALAAVALLAEGKFYTLFSLLFGFGFMVQHQRGATLWRLVRRHVALLAIGLCHAYFVWSGDILTGYGVLGLLLLFVRRASARALAVWGIALNVGTALVGTVGIGALALFGGGVPHDSAADKALIAEGLRVYAGSDWWAMVVYRARELSDLWFASAAMVPSMLAMFLIGMAIAKARWLHDVGAHRADWRRVRLLCLAPALVGNVALALAEIYGPESALSGWLVAEVVGAVIGGPSLCMVYVASIVLALEGREAGRFGRALASAGRMALTNYLAQSLVCTAIFYGFGAGLIGRVTPAASMLIVFGLWLVELAWSTWWFRRFRFGPLEKVLRAITYVGSSAAPAGR